MPRYEQEFKEQVVRRMMPPNAKSVAEVSRETGVSEATLYAWCNEYRRAGKAVAAAKKRARRLERELKRKEKALAEAAALLVLRKKAEAIWGASEGGLEDRRKGAPRRCLSTKMTRSRFHAAFREVV